MEQIDQKPTDFQAIGLTRNTISKLRIEKALMCERTGRTITYTDMVMALLNHWREHPPIDPRESLHLA